MISGYGTSKVTMNPTICNGCGGESPAWGELCKDCSQEVYCQNCTKLYKRGQGLIGVNLCATCLNEAFMEPEPEYVPKSPKPVVDPYEVYGFDHSWEL